MPGREYHFWGAVDYGDNEATVVVRAHGSSQFLSVEPHVAVSVVRMLDTAFEMGSAAALRRVRETLEIRE